MDGNYDVITLLSKNLYFKKAWGSHHFAEIIKIVKVLKDSRKARRIRKYVSKWNIYLDFLIKPNLLISGNKMLMSAGLKRFAM